MQTASVVLLFNGTAPAASQVWPGGRGVFSVCGTLGGASVNLQALGPDNVTWIDIGATTDVTAASHVGFEFSQGSIRANVVGGTPSGLYATASRVPQ